MTDTEISRYMALLLRHKPEIAGLVLDKQGWADVDMLLKCISENMEPVSFERLCEIVKNDSKQRYSFNEDKSRIRANQGHSVNVDVGLKAAVPPEYLITALRQDLSNLSTAAGLSAKQGFTFICHKIPKPQRRLVSDTASRLYTV